MSFFSAFAAMLGFVLITYAFGHGSSPVVEVSYMMHPDNALGPVARK
jgi:hypothetical protein